LLQKEFAAEIKGIKEMRLEWTFQSTQSAFVFWAGYFAASRLAFIDAAEQAWAGSSAFSETGRQCFHNPSASRFLRCRQDEEMRDICTNCLFAPE
jgi:hypothetical protein